MSAFLYASLRDGFTEPLASACYDDAAIVKLHVPILSGAMRRGAQNGVMPVSLTDSVVLVVGASSGIGRSIAVHFAREGSLVIAAARRADRLHDLQSELGAENFKVHVRTSDATDAAQMTALASEVIKEFGKVDIMIYAAGTNTPDRAMTRLRPDIWNDLISANLNGAYYATQAVLPDMRNRRAGHLIYIASISGLAPDASGAAYQASKRGLVGLAHAIRLEEKENGIRTCALCPGLVETEILEKRPVKPSPEQLAKALQPEDIAEMTVAIAKLSPRAAVPEIQIMPASLS